VLQSRNDEPQQLLELLKKGPEPLQSHFATGYGMVLKLLNQRTMASARAFVERSFYNYLGVALFCHEALDPSPHSIPPHPPHLLIGVYTLLSPLQTLAIIIFPTGVALFCVSVHP